MQLLAALKDKLSDPGLRAECGEPVWFKCQIAVPNADPDQWCPSLLELAISWIGVEPNRIDRLSNDSGVQTVWLCRFPAGQAATLVVATGQEPMIFCDALGQQGGVYLDESVLPAGWQLEPLPPSACQRALSCLEHLLGED